MTNRSIHLAEENGYKSGDEAPIKAFDNGDGTYSLSIVPYINARSAQIEGERLAIPVGTYDVWDGVEAIIPIPDSTGQPLAIKSTSINDTLLGSGAREIAIEYIDVEGYAQTELISLNGTSEVITGATNIIFVNDIFVTKNGDAANNNKSVAAGDISVYKIGTPTLVYDLIKAGGNKSLSTLRKIPKGTRYRITGVVVSGNSKGVYVKLRTTESDSGVRTEGFIFRLPITIGDNPVSVELKSNIVVNEGVLLKITAYVPAGASGGNVSCIISGDLENI